MKTVWLLAVCSVFVTACASRDAPPPPGPPVMPTTSVQVRGTPHRDTPTIRVRQEEESITWRNETGTVVVLVETSGIFSSGPIAPGETYRLEGLMPGTYRVQARTLEGAVMWEGEVRVENTAA